jgi:nucleotide-binding universal stress UspA family protein
MTHMATKRRSGEAGHRRKFLVVIDETPEVSRALRYAGRRAEHTGGAVVLLYVIGPTDFQHWVGVENIMRAEAMEAAEAALGRYADMVRAGNGIEPELVIREGNRADEIVKLIESDEDIAILVLAAASDKEGPGPLVTALAGSASGTFPVAITIVPGHLDDEAIAAIS